MSSEIFENLQGRGSDYGVRHLRALTAIGLEAFVANVGQVTLQRSRDLIELGAVYVNGLRVQSASVSINSLDLIRIHFEPRRFSVSDKLRSRIVSWTIDSLIVDKPSGLPTHALVDNARENLISLLKLELELELENQGERPKSLHCSIASPIRLLITHRLDVETSGHLLLALTSEAQSRINLALKDKRLRRRYHAWIESFVVPGHYLHHMKKTPDAPKTVSLNMEAGSKECRLDVLSCEVHEGPLMECGLEWIPRTAGPPKIWRVQIELQTGRSQQIRAQLAQMNSPILGDVIYGSPYRLVNRDTGGKAIALRAYEIVDVSDCS